MSAEAAPAAQEADFFRRAVQSYETQTGQPALAWLLIALANAAFQAAFYCAMRADRAAAGEFGTLNAALGIIGLLTLPLLALHQAFRLYPMHPPRAGQDARLDSLRSSAVTVIETSALIWAACCCLLTLVPLPLPYLPRYPLQLLALLNVLAALGSVVTGSVYENRNQYRRWIILLVAAALIRMIAGGVLTLTPLAPWAETGLTVFLLASLITLIPALRTGTLDWPARLKTCRAVFDHDFLVFTGATLSVFLGIYLFSNADRIVTLRWVDTLPDQRVMMSSGTQDGFDFYQASGLWGRALLWGTQPLLWILFARRARLTHTTAASLTFFWLYLAALVLGALILGTLTQPHTLHAMGDFFQTAGYYAPTFAAVMIPLGLLQGLGIFSIASRRYPECFVLGGCSLVYTLVLLLFGRRPETMLPYMFGASIISLMAVLFVGVVRWGRRQP
jgi:hypothetical protein